MGYLESLNNQVFAAYLIWKPAFTRHFDLYSQGLVVIHCKSYNNNFFLNNDSIKEGESNEFKNYNWRKI